MDDILSDFSSEALTKAIKTNLFDEFNVSMIAASCGPAKKKSQQHSQTHPQKQSLILLAHCKSPNTL